MRFHLFFSLLILCLPFLSVQGMEREVRMLREGRPWYHFTVDYNEKTTFPELKELIKKKALVVDSTISSMNLLLGGTSWRDDWDSLQLISMLNGVQHITLICKTKEQVIREGLEGKENDLLDD